MNVDRVLDAFNQQGVDYLLIGGMNFLLRHEPVLTYDVALWIDDMADNRRRCEQALADLDAQWGAADEDWGCVREKAPGWLDRQGVFCLTSPSGAIDVFRHVAGLPAWSNCRGRAVTETTKAGIRYRGLADQDMLDCQLALPAAEQKRDRVRVLRKALGFDDDA